MKIVLATDGNAPAAAAVRLVAGLAHRGRTSVVVVSVCGFETVLAEAEKVGHYDPVAGRRRAEAACGEAVARLRAAGFQADGMVEEGDPAQEILKVAARADAELVVVGAGHTRRLEVLLLGSTSTKILHTAPSSVLVVHAAADEPGAVLVGTDGSDGSRQAVRALADLLDPRRARVQVLAATGAVVGAAETDDVGRSARQAAEAAADEASAILRQAGFEVGVEIADGDAATTLLERADEHDLVVVGSRGLGAIRRALIGSVSDALARQAPATLVGR